MGKKQFTKRFVEVGIFVAEPDELGVIRTSDGTVYHRDRRTGVVRRIGTGKKIPIPKRPAVFRPKAAR